MGTLVYNDANISNPTISDFESEDVPTVIITSPYTRYFISSNSIAYAGVYISGNFFHLHYASSVSSYVTYVDKTGSNFGTIFTRNIVTPLSARGIFVSDFVSMGKDRVPNVTPFDTRDDLYQAFEEAIHTPITYTITYRLTNATTAGPNEAAVGDTVTVPLSFSEGYGVVNPLSDAYVTCNGVLVPSTYSDGQLVFTMPDPS